MTYIATTTEDDVQWLMAAGQSLGLAVAQLRHHLAQTLGPAHAALLAEPVEDAAGRATDWYGDGDGAAIPLDQLPPPSRAAMTNAVWALLRDIRAEGRRLGTSADADERVLGAMLEKVSHVPDLSFVRIRNETALLIAWAHGRAGQSVDLAQLLQPVDVPAARPKPPPPPAAGRATRARSAWLLPGGLLALALVALALFVVTRRQADDTQAPSTVEVNRPSSLPVPPSTEASLPPSRPDPATPARSDAVATASPPAPTPRRDAAAQTTSSAPTPAAPTSPAPTAPRPDATAQATPPTSTPSSSRRDPVQPAPSQPPASPVRDATAQSTPPKPQANTDAARTADTDAPSTNRANSSSSPQDDQPRAPDPSADRRQHADAAPTDPKPVLLPPHEAEAAPAARPFTVASIQSHDLSLFQGCWTLRGSFATADVQTGAAAKVARWRTCFPAPEPGADTLTGTQTLAWADGKSCSGPVTARFLPDDKLEIADASDCLGDRTLFRMDERCARKDDGAMLCAWTAHDRAANTDVQGEGLSLTPAR